MSAPSTGGGSRPDPYAVFRPRQGRRVAVTMSVVSVVIFTGGALSMPGWGVVDRTGLIVCGLAVAAVMWRFASIRAVPSSQGLVIRNLFTTRTFQWAQVVRVQFGGGSPWVSLDLDDTETVAIMAIQKADGSFGRAEASRLSALVQVHSTAPPPI
jgi:hypothetical protein